MGAGGVPDEDQRGRRVPVATCLLWIYSTASGKLQNSVKIPSKWETRLIFYQFGKLFRLGCRKLKFNAFGKGV